MKFFFVAGFNCVVDPARRLAEAGHDVVLWFKDGENDCFDGIVPKVADPQELLSDPDRIVVFDDIGSGALQDRLRAEGRLVVGGSAAGERLELDRAFGQEVCRENGLPVVPYQQVDDLGDAIAFVEANPRRWVVKHGPLDEHRVLDIKGARPDGSDVVARLRVLSGRLETASVEGMMIQEYIDGIEVGIGAWFNGDDWVMPFNVTLEHQPIMAGDVGPNTGEMYTTLWHRSDRTHPFFVETLEPITSFLRAQRHVGYVDLNGIVDEAGFHPLEWTVRFGMPTFMAQYRQMAGHLTLTELLGGLAAGTLERFDYSDGYAIAALVAAPPFPFPGYQEQSKGMRVFLPDDPDFLEHLHLVEVRRSEEGYYVTAGTEGYCFLVTDLGATPELAGRRVLERIEQIQGLPWLYRNDLGHGETRKLERLAALGYDVAPSGADVSRLTSRR